MGKKVTGVTGKTVHCTRHKNTPFCGYSHRTWFFYPPYLLYVEPGRVIEIDGTVSPSCSQLAGYLVPSPCKILKNLGNTRKIRVLFAHKVARIFHVCQKVPATHFLLKCRVLGNLDGALHFVLILPILGAFLGSGLLH